MPKPAKPEYLRGRRRCAFCSKFNKISKEHVFPDWLREFFPRDDTSVHTSAHIAWPENVITKAPMEKRRFGQGHVGSKKVRVVCVPCNTGWLSALEERTRLVLIPLIIGRRRNLQIHDLMTLATWATKTSMVAEYLLPINDGISQKERGWMMQHQIPPQNWFVWIGAYNGKSWRDLSIYQNRGGLDVTPVRRPSEARYHIQSTTFGVGHILFLTLSSSLPSISNKFAGREADGFFQIWPPQPRSILWPPVRILGDPQANAIANVISLSRAFDHSFDPGANWTFTF